MESRAKLLGHPIHPMLIPFPLGLLGMAAIFDLLAVVAGQTSLGQASRSMIAAGIITGLLAAVFGAIDWTAIPDGTRAKGIATTHGLGNVIIVVLFTIAWWLRRDTPGAPSGLPLALEVIGVVGALVTGWLGGELVDRLGVGVDPGSESQCAELPVESAGQRRVTRYSRRLSGGMNAQSGESSGAGGSLPIGDYALIGDCRSAALVARDGSLDWLCWPRFDSPAIFAALLDTERGGRFCIRPVGPFRTERRYLPDSNVLETVFHTSSGAVALRDLMPVSTEEEKQAALLPEHEILREVAGLQGEVAVEVVYAPRPDYGGIQPRLQQRGPFGLQCEADGAVISLLSELPLEVAGDDGRAGGTAMVRGGDRKYLSLTYSAEAPAVAPPLGELARDRMCRSERWWRNWASRCAYQGPYRAAVVRSALALKLMTYAPSGAVIAAPTTSLPEKLGGTRNWDYRYCWLRDASFTLRALFDLGYHEEGEAFLHWMLHATRLSWPELQVLYDVFGGDHLPERQLPHLAGYANSRPVRVGNDAYGQLQLDVYGEVIDAAARFAHAGGHFDRDTASMLAGLGRTVCARWQEADEGIWEGRSGRFQHTHSKVLCWVALDRLIELHRSHLVPIDVAMLRRERDNIRATIERRGYNERLGSYTRLLDGDDLDASLLTLPLYGYADAAHPRMAATCARIREQLGRDALVSRYAESTRDGLPAGEGAFGICSFWAVECQARGGDLAGAAAAFERLLGYANDVGLLAEEIDWETGAALGNFPQAFTHVGLINAALTLAECGREQQLSSHVTSA